MHLINIQRFDHCDVGRYDGSILPETVDLCTKVN